MDFTIQKSEKSSDGVWAFFDKIRDVDNLNPAEEQNTAFECLHQGTVIGMAVVDTFPQNHTTIDRIAVDKSYRQCGAGTALLSHLQNEYTSLRCEVHTDNIPSQKMVESAGFKQNGTGRYDELFIYTYNM